MPYHCRYWVHDKDETPMLPVVGALKRTMLYHLGSIAYGSFLVAVIQVILCAVTTVGNFVCAS